MPVSIIYRSVKGTPLTNDEVDSNFSNLAAYVFDKSSAALATYITDGTGSGAAMFAVNPTIVSGMATSSALLTLWNTVATTVNAFGATTALTIGALTGTTLVNNNIHCLGDIQAYSTSDVRLKNSIKNIPEALDKVKRINGVTWKWNSDYEESKLAESPNSVMSPEMGVIAQEVLEVLPELVTMRESGYLAVDYQRLTAVLIEAVKELSAKVDALQSQLITA